MSTSASSLKPFTISVAERDLSLLQEKLFTTRFPNELDEANWEYGAPLADIKRLVSYWKDGYNWRKHEQHINASLPQFTINIPVRGFETLNIHFVHKRSEIEDAIPLLFVHGWPGSFLEVTKILPLLTAPSSKKSPSFHVVAFSLPGYGFSQCTKKKGFSVKHYAEITRKIGQLYGNTYCKASHTNMVCGTPPEFLRNPLLYLQHALAPYTAFEKAGLARTSWYFNKGSGYVAEQSTQPQTLGYSLGDSPVGLLAWIYEKLVNWSDDYPWKDDEILTWVSIYWFSREGPSASLRIYYEAAQVGDWDPKSRRLSPKVPVGVSIFPKELCPMPKTWLRTEANIVFTKEHASGGHFAAHERPIELVDDLRTMFGKGGPAYGVIKGRTRFGKAPDLRVKL